MAANQQAGLWICSRTAPTYAGGLAAYQLGLAANLSGSPPTNFVALEPGHHGKNPARPVPPNTILLGATTREYPVLWSRMASKPIFHPLLEAWIARACAPPANLPLPRAVHFVGAGWDYFGFALAAYARNCGVKFTIWPAVHPEAWGDDHIDLRLYRRADAVFCQSEFEVSHLVRRGLPQGKAVLCPLPPMCRHDGDPQTLRAKIGFGARPAVLFLGRRDQGKGYPALLEAWPMVLEQIPNALLLLGGPGGEEYTSLLERIPAGARFDLGVADDTSTANALAACDLLCVPSAHESFGIVYAEAWSYGKPVICGPAPATVEWLNKCGGGLQAEQGARDVADKVLRLLGDSGLRRELGEKGRAYQQKFLTWEKAVEIHRRAFGFDA